MQNKNQIRCFLTGVPRLLNIDYQVAEFGYLPDLVFWNNHRLLHELYYCIILNRKRPGRSLRNGRHIREVQETPYLSVIKRGTILHTIQAGQNDQIFFCYSGKAADAMEKLELESGHFELTPEILEIVAEVKKTIQQPRSPMKADQLDLLALRFLSLIQASRQGLAAQYSEDGTRFSELVSHIQMHIQEKLELNSLLSRFGFSRRSFFRIWKKKFSVSYTEFVCNSRLAAAEKLLTETMLPLTEVAARSGFSSVHYLITRFQRRWGCTPGNYRKIKKAEKINLKTI